MQSIFFHSRKVSLFLIFFIIFSCQKVQYSSTQTNSLSQKADEYMTALTDLGQFNGVVLLEKNGTKILKKS